MSGRIKSIGNWTLEVPIGSGSFAIVWKATHRINGTVAAIKEINTEKLSKKLKENLASEIAVLERIRHENIVCLIELIREPGKIYLVLEYCNGGDLGQYLRKYGRIKESTACYLLKQLAEGLKILRLNNVVHVSSSIFLMLYIHST
mmetsp:Transcript_6115/g.11721  ORF Transcript_6115/g.11721 Transcript_6115/m.11721 type:complete len:146 (+) Transcript_6115:107-544(+)